MKYFFFFFIFSLFSVLTYSQQQPERSIRIVDTLSAQEKANRNPVLLKSEIDSILAAQSLTIPQQSNLEEKLPAEVKLSYTTPVIIGVSVLLAALIFFLVLLLKRQKQILRSGFAMRQQVKELSQVIASPETGIITEKQSRQKAALEKRIEELTSELEKQRLTNESALKDYQAIKESIAAGYKVRNYPGFEKKKGEGELVKELLSTERSVASYAFEKFLKPLIAVADANKNNPARMSKEDGDKLFDLLISLSLFYIEYLYLRIDELSVGGHIVQRIGNHAKGNGIDLTLLKELNTDHGSRALAIRMALDKKGIGKLSYPVFDETNLNNA